MLLNFQGILIKCIRRHEIKSVIDYCCMSKHIKLRLNNEIDCAVYYMECMNKYANAI